jgi:hypothetical protein
MKIYLIKTPEYELESFGQVAELLESYDGPLEFISTLYEFDRNKFYFLQYDLFPHHNFRFPSIDTTIKFDPERDNPLSWRELFSLCNFYRELLRIEKNCFVVLLTNRSNSLNWFSAKDEERNIFVHTAGWNQYTHVDSKYPIAYQVVENIMQSLMKADTVRIPNDYVHEPLKGCMNDFCNNKNEVLIKLQTGNICQACIKKIQNENVNSGILQQAKSIFSGIRNEFIFKVGEQPANPSSIVVSSNAEIMLPEFNLEINLSPLFKTLYIFYLKHTEGVRLNELYDFENEILSLYKKLTVHDDNEEVEARIKALIDPVGGSFSQKKSKLNKIVTDLLGDQLAKHYRIEGAPGNAFKINLPSNLIDIRY